MTLNLLSTVVLGLQTFDMGLISDNCGDQEFCVPFVKPIALAGWMLVSGSFAFVKQIQILLVIHFLFLFLALDELFDAKNLLANK